MEDYNYQEMRKIKFAVVGMGHIGNRHAEMIVRNKEAELVAVVDIKAEKEEELKKYGVPFFNSMESFLSSDIECDVVNIASPNGHHASQALAAFDAGKSVVLEKPMALSKVDAEKVIYKALNVHRHLFAVMQNRYSPPSVWLKEMIDSGLLGEIYMVQVNCFWNRDERYYSKGNWHGDLEMDGGTLFTQFSHFHLP